MSFAVDDLFRDEPDPLGRAFPRQALDTRQVDQLRQSPSTELADVDAAVALLELLQSEYLAFGTDGGQRLSNQEVGLVHRTARAVLRRQGLEFSPGWSDFTSFKSYWVANDGHGSWAARRGMVGAAFSTLLEQLHDRQDATESGSIAARALDALPDASAIREHLRRLAHSVDSDPRLAVSVAKDLVESTAKLVLKERGVVYSGKEDLPALVSRAQEALKLSAAGVPDASEEAQALRTILGSLTRLTQGVTELRNKVGVGHGRESVPVWVKPRHARLAAGAATVWCNLMLETLGDPDAPWRSAT